MSAGLEFKPRMLGIVCNWCCYGGADLAGVSRFQYPPYIRLIRVMCSGRVDLSHILRAFLNGQDGVFIGGCHFGDCHYITNGNYDALSMVHVCKKILKHIGVYPERLRIEWVSAGEGIRFANVMNEFSAEVKGFGPLGKGEGLNEKGIKLKLEAAAKLVPYIRLVLTEKLRTRFGTMEEYADFFCSDEVDRLFQELIADKLAATEILMLLREKPRSIGEISDILGMDSSEVARHLNGSVREKLAEFDQNRKCFVCG